MKTFDEERRMVPRWRTFTDAIQRRELVSSGGPRERKIEKEGWFTEKEKSFNRDQSVVPAFEFLSAAIIAGNIEAAKTAAAVLATSQDVSDGVRQFAEDILTGSLSTAYEMLPLNQHAAISKRRAWVSSHPRDAIVWAELALCFSYTADRQKARRSIETALALSPENRYVARSATRFFLHEGEPERAFSVLDRSRRLLLDPWLASAGLAVVEILGRRPNNIRAVRSLLESDADDHSLSELRGSLGSLEYREGSARKARKLFLDSLKDASENALAHLSWYQAKKRIFFYAPATLEETSVDFEGKAWRSAAGGDWEEAIVSCRQWAGAEPYSSRPYVLGSYLSCVTENDPSTGRQLAQAGIRANPDHPTLLNNLAFSFARLGQLDQGRQFYLRARTALRKASDDVALWALDGLWAYREGNIVRGRSCYAHAVKLCGTSKEQQDAAYRLALHWMEEEIDSETEGPGKAALAVVRSGTRPNEPDVEAMRARVEAKCKDLPSSSGEAELVSALRSGRVIV